MGIMIGTVRKGDSATIRDAEKMQKAVISYADR